jgi:nucleotide-binding universal stress UspA family protein
VWSFPAAYDDLALSITEVEETNKLAATEIQHAIDGFASEMQDVPYRLDVRRAPVADALLEAGKTSDLLVVGRHDSRIPLGSHLGPVARAVLREAECPVLLVDPRPAAGDEREPSEAAGQMV